VAGHRGLRGELTVKVRGGDASAWDGAGQVRIGDARGRARDYEVESSRAYADKWVLKLVGVDDANAAERLRGETVQVALEDAPPLDEGEFWSEKLIGMRVVLDADDTPVGRVVRVEPTGGKDLLVVRGDGAPDGEEVMVPFVEEIVSAVDEAGRVIRIRPPEGLLELNERTP